MVGLNLEPAIKGAMRLRASISALCTFTAAVMAADAASAACTRLAFSVNDYGKDGPTKDAKDLLDKYIAKWTSERGIKKYNTGKKDVSCELYLDVGVFDEHTCKAAATVCWEGAAPAGVTAAGAAGAAPKAKATSTPKPAAAAKAAAAPAPASMPMATGSLPTAAAVPAPTTPAIVAPATEAAAAAAGTAAVAPAPVVEAPKAQ
jgi:hypothetical protein